MNSRVFAGVSLLPCHTAWIGTVGGSNGTRTSSTTSRSRLAFGTFELCAAMPDRSEIAAVMSDVLGRPIAPGEASFNEWAAHLPLGPDQKELLAKVFKSYAASGSGGNSLVLRAVLGREPRSLCQYIEDLASATP